MARRLIVPVLTAAVLLLTALVPPSSAARMPSKRQWEQDVRAALSGSTAYVHDRVAKGGRKLALNLDIDNTSLESHYAPGKPVPATLRLVTYAKSQGVSILFNTGRNVRLRAETIQQLKQAGYPVDGLCAHYSGESLAASKQRCRQSFVNNGFTIIANIGNRGTDFVGGNYERAYRLPNYGNRLA